jgi:CubicO group peptidase (beta-lactamase class C family)
MEDPMLPSADPESVGVSSARLERAFDFARGWVADGTLPAVTALVARRGVVVGRAWAGTMSREPGAPPVGADTLFPVASVTKPFTATAITLLAERGVLSIDQPVLDFIPEFVGDGDPRFARITLRHFLTHTSGLPEYTEENESIRRRHLGLDAFVRAYCQGSLLFDPGTRYSYSNFGYGLLGEIVARASGRGYHEFVAGEILAPTGMKDSYLQPPTDVWPRIADCWLLGEPHTDYERYNSAYFRQLGIPWGGLYTTPDDLAAFGQLFLDGGKAGGESVLAPAIVREMTRDQLDDVPGAKTSLGEEIPAASRGLGWDVKGKKVRTCMGELTALTTFGHTGSSGAMLWVDPTLDLTCVLIGTRTLESGWAMGDWPRQALFSNAVAAAVEA